MESTLCLSEHITNLYSIDSGHIDVVGSTRLANEFMSVTAVSITPKIAFRIITHVSIPLHFSITWSQCSKGMFAEEQQLMLG
jgi:hypothetical protein